MTVLDVISAQAYHIEAYEATETVATCDLLWERENIHFFDQRREYACTDWENDGGRSRRGGI
jgi:hypothetical protein